MPVARTCAHCKKTFLCSTYTLIDHVFNKCPEFKKYQEKKNLTQFSKPNSSSNISIVPISTPFSRKNAPSSP